MRRPTVIRTLGIALAAGLALAVLNRPPIQARTTTEAKFGGFGGGEPEADDDGPVIHLAARPMSREALKVWLKLQEKADWPLAEETPLEDVVKHVQAATADKEDFPEGVPIYVDPRGLQEADKTMASTVRITLKGIPLATTLGLTLKQLGLAYRVHQDGLLLITAEGSEELPADALILDRLSALGDELKALRREVRDLRGGIPANRDEPARGAAAPPGGMKSMGGMM